MEKKIIKIVTITGADDSIKPKDLFELSEKYPFVEWGILFSSKNNGKKTRYPSLEWVSELMEWSELINLSAHLCGDYAKEVISGSDKGHEILKWLSPAFKRFQINYNFEFGKSHNLREFHNLIDEFPNRDFILQYNESNKKICDYYAKLNCVQFLYDSSGGIGKEITNIPLPIENNFTGYAGGISPENIVSKIEEIKNKVQDTEIWIDMETSVRSDEDKLFDLNKVENCLILAQPYIAKKKFKNGLVLGKFYIPHLGHCHLIDSAIEQCETVYVMVCSLKNELVSGNKRVAWVQEIYEKNENVIVIHCDDENPQYPNECESLDMFYNDYWVPTVYKNIDELDVVFTSEIYGDEFAHYLGIEHVLVDIERKTFPISGTKMRDNIFANWDYLPDVVKKDYQKTVLVIGTESCGKSTLVKKLAEIFKGDVVKEYGRIYVESIPTNMLEKWDFEVIATNHYRLVQKAKSELKNMFLFVDTDAIITKTFSEMYLGEDNVINVSNILYNHRNDYDLVLLLTPEVAWINDGTRDFQDERLKHFELIKKELATWSIPYVLIDGDSYDKRNIKAFETIENLNTFVK
jgi:HTH-type transcriptional repressor of NAD biosynthesis genes